MLRSLTLVRHGESEWNSARRIQGHQDSGLSEAGRAQADLLGKRLRHEDFDAVYSSDLSRAWQTAEIATARAREQLLLTPDLREHCFGRWQGLSPEEVADLYPGEWSDYRSDPLHNRPEGGESVLDLKRRVQALLEQWHSHWDGASLLAFTHGGVVRMATILTMGLPVSPWGVLRVANTGVTRLDFGQEGPVLRSFNSTGHLLHAGDTPQAAGDETDER